MITVAGKIYMRLLDALGWRLRRVFGDHRIDRILIGLARLWRPLLTKPVFIGITGSAGKSTTKELLVGVLSYQGRGVANPGTLNMVAEVAKTILQAMPWHSFCISEVGAPEPGAMDEPLALLQPSVGIVTVIANDHLAAYGSREAIAAEKGKLTSTLPATGTAVLNADDELVVSMMKNTNAKVLSYGVCATADLRAEDITSAWPDRLAFTALYGTERVHVRTQLCGTHWIPAVLSAIGGGLATGMSLSDCAAGIATVAPFEGRMQPVTTPDGVTFIRDDFKAPLWTLDACFDFMKAAQAKRKIIVIGDLSDVATKKEKVYGRAAIVSQDIADVTVFVGPWASSALKARRPGAQSALQVFAHVRDAAEFINANSKAGDLILLKGTVTQNHLSRILLARTNEIACWRDDCARNMFCNECPDRMKPAGAQVVQQKFAVEDFLSHSGFASLEANEQLIVGLGNPEARYSNTPHNIGYAALDLIAATMGLEWIATPEVLFARGIFEGRAICLVKVQANMNLIGAELKKLSERMAFTPAQCVLVYDDLDLSLGVVRPRMSGSAGGHRGVASILEAFQTDAFRRVKIGVARGGVKIHRVEDVLKPFGADELATLGPAMVLAEARVMEMLTMKSKSRKSQ